MHTYTHATNALAGHTKGKVQSHLRDATVDVRTADTNEDDELDHGELSSYLNQNITDPRYKVDES